jgi:hypothetical protein
MDDQLKKIKSSYDSLTGEYQKFGFVRLVIVITLVLTIANSIKSLNTGQNTAKAAEIIALKEITGSIPETNDWALRLMFFSADNPIKTDDINHLTENEKQGDVMDEPVIKETITLDSVVEYIDTLALFVKKDTTTVLPDTLIDSTLPALPDTLQHTAAQAALPESLPDTVQLKNDDLVKNSIKKQKELLTEIEKSMTTAFIYNAPFFNGATIDLRFWIIILPFLFILTQVYVFLLLSKINVLVLAAKQIEPEAKDNFPDFIERPLIPFTAYPFRFIKTTIFLIEAFLLTALTIFLFYFSQDLNTILVDIIKAFYFFMIVYAIGYCQHMNIKIKASAFGNVYPPSLLEKILLYGKQLLKSCIDFVGPRLTITTGSLLLLFTLLLTVGQGCNEKGIKGYKFISQTLDKDTTWFYYSRISLFYNFAYVLAIVFAVAALVYLIVKKIKPGYTAFADQYLFNGLYFLSGFFVIIFSFQVGTRYFLAFDLYLLPLLLFFIIYWSITFRQTLSSLANQNLVSQKVNRLIIYLLPFLIISFGLSLSLFKRLNGLIFLIAGLLLCWAGFYFLNNVKKQTALKPPG